MEVRHVANALDLDEPLAIKDLLAEDRRAKFEMIGQARLVITNGLGGQDRRTDRGAPGVGDRD